MVRAACSGLRPNMKSTLLGAWVFLQEPRTLQRLSGRPGPAADAQGSTPPLPVLGASQSEETEENVLDPARKFTM